MADLSDNMSSISTDRPNAEIGAAMLGVIPEFSEEEPIEVTISINCKDHDTEYTFRVDNHQLRLNHITFLRGMAEPKVCK